MNITLISPYPDITSFGLRTMSAHLKRNGHKTRMIFIPDPFGEHFVFGMKRYEDHVLDEVVSLCRDADLIGMTLMTNFFSGAVQVTERIKRELAVPVIWGGVHPTIRPEESLGHADLVCVGDGEEALLELANKMAGGQDYSTTPNIWLKSDGRIIRNPVRPLEKNLDVYPLPDYSTDDHHVLHNGRLQRLTADLTREFLKRSRFSRFLKSTGLHGYQTMTGRGCPHQCTYCINDAIRNLYGDDGYLRWRSTGHVMDELLWVKKHMPHVGFIWISDDAFFARNSKALEEFCREYREKIGLPFSCLASPPTVTEDKMAMLVDAGLVYVQMGIQTGSSMIQELFNRKQMTNEKVLQAVRTINSQKDRMYPPSYDFILDVPYETERDAIESLRLIALFPKPFELQTFSLILYPGTKLHAMASKDGLIRDERKEVYDTGYATRKREPNYLNLLMVLSKGGKFPGPLLKILVGSPLVEILNSRALRPFFRLLYRLLQATYNLTKKLIGNRNPADNP